MEDNTMEEQKFRVFSKKLGKSIVITVPPEVVDTHTLEKVRDIFRVGGIKESDWQQWAQWSEWNQWNEWFDWSDWSDWDDSDDEALARLRIILDPLIARRLDPEIQDPLKGLQSALEQAGYKGVPLTQRKSRIRMRRARGMKRSDIQATSLPQTPSQEPKAPDLTES
jgi:hypothetical protein